MDGIENYNSSDLNITQYHNRRKNPDWAPHRKLEVPTVILICKVIQSLDARNWEWVEWEHIHMKRHANVPPYKLQNSIRATIVNEQIKNVHCCDNHADESCTISMTKSSSKPMDCRRWSTLTCYPIVPTLQKDWGREQTNELVEQLLRVVQL